jgi:hypothetical protein
MNQIEKEVAPDDITRTVKKIALRLLERSCMKNLFHLSPLA